MFGCTLSQRDNSDPIAPFGQMGVAPKEGLEVGVGQSPQAEEIVIGQWLIRPSRISPSHGHSAILRSYA